MDPKDALTLLPDRLALPRGRAALTDAEVVRSQYGRILQAVTDEVGELGFQTTSVARIIRRAKVSRSTFYENFTDKEDAFAAAHLAASWQLIDVLRDSARSADGAHWTDFVRSGVQAYLTALESSPNYAYAFMLESRAAGDRLLNQRDLTIEIHADSFQKRARAIALIDDEVRVPDEFQAIAVMGATDELACRGIRRHGRGEALDLAFLVDPITFVHCAAMERRQFVSPTLHD